MDDLDPNTLVTVLDPQQRGVSLSIDQVMYLAARLPGLGESPRLARLVARALRTGEQEGRWTTTRTTVRVGGTRLPKRVMVLPTADTSKQQQAVNVPLRKELASWAAELRLDATQRRVLTAVNEWLQRTDGGQVPMAAATERAYELLGDEHAFNRIPPLGGPTLWGPGRLSLEMLRCERATIPLTWEVTTRWIGKSASILCVSHHATYRTLLGVLRAQQQPRWAAVAWVRDHDTTALQWLPRMPFRVANLEYLDDLDAAGLRLARAVCDAAWGVGVPAGPAISLWELLARQPARAARTTTPSEADKLIDWLPESLRARAREMIVSGRSIPQTALRAEIVSQALATMPPDPPAQNQTPPGQTPPGQMTHGRSPQPHVPQGHTPQGPTA